MASFSIVPDCDVFEGELTSGFARLEDWIVEFAFHRAEETLDDGVIPAVALAAHAADEVVAVVKPLHRVGPLALPASSGQSQGGDGYALQEIRLGVRGRPVSAAPSPWKPERTISSNSAPRGRGKAFAIGKKIRARLWARSLR